LSTARPRRRHRSSSTRIRALAALADEVTVAVVPGLARGAEAVAFPLAGRLNLAWPRGGGRALGGDDDGGGAAAALGDPGRGADRGYSRVAASGGALAADAGIIEIAVFVLGAGVACRGSVA